MSFVDVLRLYRNRCGVFCFRLKAGARDQRVSLGTECPLAAHMIASKINAAVASARAREQGTTGKNPTLAELGLDLAAIRKYEIDPAPARSRRTAREPITTRPWRRSIGSA